jgi:hypothetical protein
VTHPLAAYLDTLARGDYPPFDAEVDVFRSPGGLNDIVIGFTGHSVVAADIDPALVRAQIEPGNLSQPLSARFLTWLGDQLSSRPGTLDALLVAQGTGAGVPAGWRATDDVGHPRVQEAQKFRVVERVFDVDGGGVALLGRGVCDRWEVGFEVEPGARNAGLGRRIVAGARGLVPAGEPLWAQVAPANAASMRSTMAAGFVPVAAEVLFRRSSNVTA